jgi:hypothetical protein
MRVYRPKKNGIRGRKRIHVTKRRKPPKPRKRIHVTKRRKPPKRRRRPVAHICFKPHKWTRKRKRKRVTRKRGAIVRKCIKG